MKYGVLTHATTMNFGDDIQTYAAAKLLPQVDYYVARESIDTFASKNNEPVGLLMNAWWMSAKWNWPPSECIYPLLVSMHICEYDIYAKGSPVKREDWFGGAGGEYFRAYGPVGCRDNTTTEIFDSCGIDNYLSGCITLTLPKQKRTADAGTYACLSGDLKPEIEAKAEELLRNAGLNVVKVSHKCDYRDTNLTFEQRMEKVEEVLTLYQNAKVVITRRLHTTLPCLAMGTPVLAIVDLNRHQYYTRWSPYSDWTRYISEKDFLNHAFDYDFNNPPANKPDYLPTRQSLIKRVEQFVAETKDYDGPMQAIKKTSYSQAEAYQWQHELMRNTLNTWLWASRKMLAERNRLKSQNRALSSEKKEIADYRKEIAGYQKEIVDYKKRVENLQKQLDRINGIPLIRCLRLVKRKAKAFFSIFTPGKKQTAR